MNFGALRGLNDPLSVYNEAIYTFYRTLKRWTTGTLQAPEPCAHCSLSLVHNLVQIAPSALCTPLCKLRPQPCAQPCAQLRPKGVLRIIFSTPLCTIRFQEGGPAQDLHKDTYFDARPEGKDSLQNAGGSKLALA